jgi:hypothetical protein
MAGASASDQKSTLLAIAPEIRNIIYRYALVSDREIHLAPADFSPRKQLLNVCKQIKQECELIFYVENRFIIAVNGTDILSGTTLQSMPSNARTLLKSVGPEHAGHLRITVEFSSPLSVVNTVGTPTNPPLKLLSSDVSVIHIAANTLMEYAETLAAQLAGLGLDYERLDTRKIDSDTPRRNVPDVTLWARRFRLVYARLQLKSLKDKLEVLGEDGLCPQEWNLLRKKIRVFVDRGEGWYPF